MPLYESDAAFATQPGSLAHGAPGVSEALTGVEVPGVDNHRVGMSTARHRLVVAAAVAGALSRISEAESSAHGLLDERADLFLFGGGQFLKREGGRPHVALVEVRPVAEAQRRVPRLELLRALEEADDLAVLGIRGHPVPGSRREVWRAAFDEGMEPLGHDAIGLRHLGNLREDVAFRVRLATRGLELLGALPHRGPFLGRESLGRFVFFAGFLSAIAKRRMRNKSEPTDVRGW